jgi:hypothetical protein
MVAPMHTLLLVGSTWYISGNGDLDIDKDRDRLFLDMLLLLL